ncbi:MAG: queuosine precursor transporter [Gammaproteobacteria bacterium]|nr:queuosine precursor transporter [Gammaproteobacteria bacterium]
MKNAFIRENKPQTTKRVVLLGMLFVTFLVVSNLTAFKVAEIQLTSDLALNFPAALIFFPLTYFFDDILTEVYGFKISRLIIWGGLLCSALVTLCTSIAVYLPSSAIWDANTNHGSSAYALVFQSSARIFFASMLAYFFGEFINSMILAKLKVQTQGKHFFLRVISSTGIGAAIDSTIFCNVAFWGVMPNHIIWKMILTIYLFKLCYEIIALPMTYALVAYLKKADGVDHYDRETKFNPFSVSLTD